MLAVVVVAVLGGGVAVGVRVGLGPRVEQRELVRYAPPTSGELVIHDVTVFNSLTGELVPRRDVVVRGERIAAVVETDPALAATPGREIIAGHGRTLLPGFVDTHVHLLNAGAPAWAPRSANPEHNLASYLYAGVTTVYDLAGFAGQLIALRDELAEGSLPGPRLFVSGPPVTALGGLPLSTIRAWLPPPVGALVAWFVGQVVYQVRDEAEARAAIADIKASGVDVVKIMYDQVPRGSPQLTHETIAAVLAAARAAGIKSFVHVGAPDDAVFAAEAGADVLAHMPYRGALTDEQATRIARTGARVACTIAAWVRFADIAAGRYRPLALDEEVSPADLLAPVTSDEGTRHDDAVFKDMSATASEFRDTWNANALTLYRAGVPFVIGSDSSVQGVYPGSSFHDELALLSRAGVPNAELLMAATSRGAALLSASPEFGTIAAGKLADLVLVEGDPIARIEATQDIALVVHNGRVVVRNRPKEPPPS